jgi:riboflavin biosynthesis pyrimidine reductase
MSTDTDFELSEKGNESNVDTLTEVNSESEVDKLEDISAEGISDIVVEGGSCAAKSDCVEGDRSEYEGNGEGNRMVKDG